MSCTRSKYSEHELQHRCEEMISAEYSVLVPIRFGRTSGFVDHLVHPTA